MCRGTQNELYFNNVTGKDSARRWSQMGVKVLSGAHKAPSEPSTASNLPQECRTLCPLTRMWVAHLGCSASPKKASEHTLNAQWAKQREQPADLSSLFLYILGLHSSAHLLHLFTSSLCRCMLASKPFSLSTRKRLSLRHFIFVSLNSDSTIL